MICTASRLCTILDCRKVAYAGGLGLVLLNYGLCNATCKACERCDTKVIPIHSLWDSAPLSAWEVQDSLKPTVNLLQNNLSRAWKSRRSRRVPMGFLQEIILLMQKLCQLACRNHNLMKHGLNLVRRLHSSNWNSVSETKI